MENNRNFLTFRIARLPILKMVGGERLKLRLMMGSLRVDSDSRYNFRNLYHVTAGALFDMGPDYSYQFNPGNEPLNRRIGNTTHEIGLQYRFGGRAEML